MSAFDDLEMSNNRTKILEPIHQRSQVYRSDCAIVAEIWLSLGKSTDLSPRSARENGCCGGRSDIPGVSCMDTQVSKMYAFTLRNSNWNNLQLTGEFPRLIGYLTGLRELYLFIFIIIDRWLQIKYMAQYPER
jgi:hypothetical protein